MSCSFAFVSQLILVLEVIEDSRLPPNIFKEKLQWSTMDADIKAFVQSCLVCTLSSSGSKVPRPLGQQIHAQRVSELLHFDLSTLENLAPVMSTS